MQETASPGTYRIGLKPTLKAGRYLVRARYLDEPLPSVLDVYILPSQLSAAHSTAAGPGVAAVPAGEPALFQVRVNYHYRYYDHHYYYYCYFHHSYGYYYPTWRRS